MTYQTTDERLARLELAAARVMALTDKQLRINGTNRQLADLALDVRNLLNGGNK